MTVESMKSALRAQARRGRRAGDPQAGHALAALALATLTFPQDAVIAGVWPLPDEMDLRPLMERLHASGFRIVLPETPPRGAPLAFRLWHPGCPMLPGRFGTVHPDGPEAVPDVIFVPLLAFDRNGNRLGYGGGYYDRTLAALPCSQAIGFGFAAQEVARVPVDRHDRRLDRVVTEREVLTIRLSEDPGT